MTDPATVAKGLTKAERALLLAAGDSLDNDYWMTPREVRTAKALQRKGLGRFVDTSWKPNGVRVYWNNPRGIEVRNLLENEQ